MEKDAALCDEADLDEDEEYDDNFEADGADEYDVDAEKKAPETGTGPDTEEKRPLTPALMSAGFMH